MVLFQKKKNKKVFKKAKAPKKNFSKLLRLDMTHQTTKHEESHKVSFFDYNLPSTEQIKETAEYNEILQFAEDIVSLFDEKNGSKLIGIGADTDSMHSNSGDGQLTLNLEDDTSIKHDLSGFGCCQSPINFVSSTESSDGKTVIMRNEDF